MTFVQRMLTHVAGMLLCIWSPLAGLNRHRGFGVLFCKSLFLLKSIAPAVPLLCARLLMELLLHPPSTLPFPPE